MAAGVAAGVVGAVVQEAGVAVARVARASPIRALADPPVRPRGPGRPDVQIFPTVD